MIPIDDYIDHYFCPYCNVNYNTMHEFAMHQLGSDHVYWLEEVLKLTR